jgi:hypothetical protein
MAWVPLFNSKMHRRLIAAWAFFAPNAEGSNRALELIKRPVIRSLLEKETKHVALRRQTFSQRRALNDAEAALSAAEAEVAAMGAHEAGYVRWGVPLVSSTYAPLEVAFLAAGVVLLVGLVVGLAIARLEASKQQDQEAASRAAALRAARAAACAQPASDKSLHRKTTNHARAAALQTVDALPPQPHSEPPTDGGLRGHHGISAPALSATSSHTVRAY